jgi:hypothetical protein
MEGIITVHIDVNIHADMAGRVSSELNEEFETKSMRFNLAYDALKEITERVYDEIEENRIVDCIVHHCLTGE